jgi:hypothetical protein
LDEQLEPFERLNSRLARLLEDDKVAARITTSRMRRWSPRRRASQLVYLKDDKSRRSNPV